MKDNFADKYSEIEHLKNMGVYYLIKWKIGLI